MLKFLRQSIVEHLRANIVAYFFIILIFIVGIVIGALAVKTLPEDQKIELVNYLKIFFQGLLKGQEVSDGGTLWAVVCSSLKTIGLMWLLGFTIVGIPFVLFIVFIRGFVIGFTVGFLVNEYVMRGIFFALAAVLPHNFFAIPAVIVTGVTATSFSLLLVRHKKRKKPGLLYQSLVYSLTCFAMLLMMLLGALIEVYISPVFMKNIVGLLMK